MTFHAESHERGENQASGCLHCILRKKQAAVMHLRRCKSRTKKKWEDFVIWWSDCFFIYTYSIQLGFEVCHSALDKIREVRFVGFKQQIRICIQFYWHIEVIETGWAHNKNVIVLCESKNFTIFIAPVCYLPSCSCRPYWKDLVIGPAACRKANIATMSITHMQSDSHSHLI